MKIGTFLLKKLHLKAFESGEMTWVRFIALRDLLELHITDFDENWSLKEMEENTTQAENLPVVLFSGDYSFTTTTDSEGNFSIVVPGELEYVLKASSEAANYGLGINVVPSDNALVELGSIYLKPLITVTGNLFVHDNVTEWNAAHFNGQQPTILAIDENGVEWEAETSPSGEFTLELASGVYRFEGRQSEYNITPVESWNVTDNILDTTVNMTALIEPVEIQIFVCLSNEDIEQCDQNYPAFGDLSFTPFSLLFDSYTVNSSDFDENGYATLEILPGNYQTQLFYTDSSDENATDFNSFYQSQNVQVNFIDDDSNDIHIILANERLMSGQVEIGNSTLQNIQFLMYNESNDQWLSINTNETGNFSSYVPYGDWIVIIADYVHENETYVYRSPITISEDVSSRTGLSITMEESVELTLTLKEELTGENLSDIRITAVSNDGYGGSDRQYTEDRVPHTIIREVDEWCKENLPKWKMSSDGDDAEEYDTDFEMWCHNQVHLWLRSKELKRLLNKDKIVYVKDNDLYTWKSKNIKKISGVHINNFKIHNKDIKIILNDMPFDKALKTYNDYLDFDKVV